MKTLIIILPAFNEAPVIGQVIKAIQTVLPQLNLKTEIIVVNDGSTDATVKVAQKSKVKVLSHQINRGLGASLSTGLAYAKKAQADYAITLDSDGQHHPQDIKVILSPLLSGKADVVIGSRTLANIKDMPWLRRLNNQAFNLLTFLLSGVKTTDSLSGFRGFAKPAIKKIQLKTERMEASNEFFIQVKTHQLKYQEVPIQVIYTNYSIQKGQKISNVFAIIFKLLLRLFR